MNELIAIINATDKDYGANSTMELLITASYLFKYGATRSTGSLANSPFGSYIRGWRHSIVLPFLILFHCSIVQISAYFSWMLIFSVLFHLVQRYRKTVDWRQMLSWPSTIRIGSSWRFRRKRCSRRSEQRRRRFMWVFLSFAIVGCTKVIKMRRVVK